MNKNMRAALALDRYAGARWLGAIALASVLQAGCGSAEQTAAAGVPEETGAVFGVVHTQAPVVGAEVVVKDRDGVLVDRVLTDSAGAYSASGSGTPPYSVQVTDPTGSALYGYGEGGRVNVTHLSSAVLSMWHRAHGSDAHQAFETLSSASALPQVPELQAANAALLAEVDDEVGHPDAELSRDQLSPELTTVLAGSTVSTDGGSITIALPDGHREEIAISASLDPEGEVVIAGTTTVKHGDGTSADDGAETFVAPLSITVGRRDAVRPQQHWMRDIAEHIADKRLADIVLPGTHDSGTAGMFSNPLAMLVAQTQTRDLGRQLNDGIRYLDLRVREAGHRGCADPSVWWLYHEFDSYRLEEALAEIKAFVETPGNEREIIVLDLQDVTVKYDDARAVAVLFHSIQQVLGKYLVDGQARTWTHKTLRQLWADNDARFLASGMREQIIVLVPDKWTGRPRGSSYPEGCGSAYDPRFFPPRGSSIMSYYEEQAEAGGIKHFLQLQLSGGAAAGDASRADRYDKYRKYQDDGLLRVLQIASRPLDAWYAAAVMYGDTLLRYGSAINREFNYLGQGSRLSRSYCAEGWLAKQVWMGMNDPDGLGGPWNRANVIIVDHYNDASPGWVSASWNGTQWTATSKGSYVEWIRRINQNIDAGPTGVMDLADGKCLP